MSLGLPEEPDQEPEQSFCKYPLQVEDALDLHSKTGGMNFPDQLLVTLVVIVHAVPSQHFFPGLHPSPALAQFPDDFSLSAVPPRRETLPAVILLLEASDAVRVPLTVRAGTQSNSLALATPMAAMAAAIMKEKDSFILKMSRIC